MAAAVVDASVVAALAFGESRAAEADRMMTGWDLFAPDLLHYELIHVAVRKIREQPDLAAGIGRGLARVFAMKIVLKRPRGMEVLNLARATGLTGYDAAYLSLARELRCSLLTFDRQLRRRT